MSTSRTYHHGNVPETILDSARTLLERMPAAQISVRELARETGLSHGAPYKHFTDRLGLLIALATRCMGEFLHAQQQAMASAPAGEKLLRLGEAYVNYGATYPHAFALIFDTEISPPGHPPAELAPLITEHAGLLQRAIADTVASGGLPGDLAPDTAAEALWSQAHGLTHLVIAGRIRPDHVRPALAAFLRSRTATPPS